ncbi:hypothetical protein E8E13_005418 [Curvularia kusanoi]|uniref:Uncharacterized protein n=1 Tax=Curvularia kusanoi TaxID=90978 RepID=A0A9P4W739_CURKU|nr:hypothetical protein E8E13_005418 [Curvularia kusanoi]
MPSALTREEAQLFHHFTRHLGRWLDCTNAPRLFTLLVSERATESSVLCNAVLCFSARHQGLFVAAEEAYERCISLLIKRLSLGSDSYDESPTHSSPGDKRHLKGTSSILRASTTKRRIDPAATSLREAAFWVYVRQCLYNATISQESLDLDFTLTLEPITPADDDKHPLDWLTRSTAWSNHILWNTARIANFCFSSPGCEETSTSRASTWQELWDNNASWQAQRPAEFDPIGSGPPRNGDAFADIWFTADWHVISYIFHHFSYILLLRYKPDFKFPTRWVRATLSPDDARILNHARAICAACKSSMGNPQLLIILCHTVFIWGPLMSSPAERASVVRMLSEFEKKHLWRTQWIVDALQAEWAVG